MDGSMEHESVRPVHDGLDSWFGNAILMMGTSTSTSTAELKSLSFLVKLAKELDGLINANQHLDVSSLSCCRLVVCEHARVGRRHREEPHRHSFWNQGGQ
jgi:hypothetical protein